MLYILTNDYSIDVCDDKGALFKAVQYCPCDTCDTDCSQCSSVADCIHDDLGNAGGMCLSKPTQDGHWERIKYYPSHRGVVDCSCQSLCQHVQSLQDEARKHLPGSRPRGIQRQKFLNRRPDLAPIEFDSQGNPTITIK